MTDSSRSVAPAFDAALADKALAELRGEPIAAFAKGFAAIASGLRPDEFVARSVSRRSELLTTPRLEIRESAVDHNISALAEYCAGRDVLVAPHAKTTMSPELFVRQLRAGAWALTAANSRQAAVFVAFGARRVLIANEVVAPTDIADLTELLRRTPDLELLLYVDSEAGLDRLVPLVGPAVRLLVELGVEDGRSGVRSETDATAVATAAVASGFDLAGVSFFEGPVRGSSGEEIIAGVRELAARARRIGHGFVERGLVESSELILSGAGSHYFDIVIDELKQDAPAGTRVVIRSGSYVTHDHGAYLHNTPSARGVSITPFVPALEVRATILSVPQPGLALIDAGRRDVSFDEGLPVVLRLERDGASLDIGFAEVVRLNDQHGFLRLDPDSPATVGDVVILGISHPCTTFHKWRLALLVDDDANAVGIAHTYF